MDEREADHPNKYKTTLIIMKHLITLPLALSFLSCLAQQPTFKQRPYGQVTAILSQGKFFGGGAVVGIKTMRTFGFGIGLEVYQIDKDLTTAAKPIFFDARFFAPGRVAHPFVAVNVGSMNWEYQNPYVDAQTKAGIFFGGEAGVAISGKETGVAPMLSFSYKRARVSNTLNAGNIHSKDYSNANYFQIKLGIKI